MIELKRQPARCATALAMAWLAVATAPAQTGDWVECETTGPSPRWGFDMAFDRQHGMMLLHGGNDNEDTLSDIWGFDGTDWTLITENGPARQAHAIAYDEARGELVLFGGNTANPPGVLSPQTWAWDGDTWSLRSEEGPSGRRNAAMVYDAERQVVVLFGGYDGSIRTDTWEWDGNTWELRAESGPPPGDHHRMVYDRARGVVVLFGGATWCSGTVFGETWEWNGVQWLQVASGGPDPRFLHGMAYDEERGATILFGGLETGACGPPRVWAEPTTWEWDGSTWKDHAISGPEPRHWHRMAYDPARRKVVLQGGVALFGSDSILTNATWCLPDFPKRQVVYEEDFSSSPDPAWETNNSLRYYRDIADDSLGYPRPAYRAEMYDNTSEYGTVHVQVPTGAFRLEFDCLIDDVNWGGNFEFGWFDATRECYYHDPERQMFKFTFDVADLGKGISLISWDDSGIAQQVGQYPTSVWNEGQWYHVRIEYDDSSKTLTAQLADVLTGAELFAGQLQDVSGFSTLENLGLSKVSDQLVESAFGKGWIDNIRVVQLTPPRGDLNCDYSFDGADIDAFFLALGDRSAYHASYPDCDPLLGDGNCDGSLDGADIDAFFAGLTSGRLYCP